MGNDVPVPVAYIGSSFFTTGSRVFHLKNVSHVPRICKNLMSVAQFAKDNQVYFEFHTFHCFVKNIKAGSIMLVGRIHNSLYQFDLSDSRKFRTTSSFLATTHAAHLGSLISSNHVFNLWHKRLGHLCDKTVTVILQKTPFELIVSDLWGPAFVASEGHFYYVSFVDAHSRYTWLYLIKCKFEALEKFIHLQSLVERKHRYIVDTGMTLLAQASVPMHLWAHAFKSASYLINRLATHVLNRKSPYEMLHKTLPNYMHLKVFGCRCYPYLRPFNTHKLQYQSRLCVFLGYSPVHKRSQIPIVVSSLPHSGFGVPSILVPLGSTGLQLRSAANIVPGNTANSRRSTPSSHPSPSSHHAKASPMDSRVVSSSNQTRSKSGIFKPRVFSTKLGVIEPVIIEEALSSKEWELAAQQEYDALLRNQTWDLVPLPINMRAIVCKWVFKLKRYSDGTIARYKVHLVVKGYLQKAPKAWFSKLKDFLLTSQFVLSKLDGSLFVRRAEGVLLYVLVYVDDIIVISNHQGSIDDFVTTLDTNFLLKDLGPLGYFLRIEVLPTIEGLFLSQRKYVLDILKRARMDQAKGSPTPMVTSTNLPQHIGSVIENAFDYSSIVGALQYVVITRPDITFGVSSKHRGLWPSATNLDLVGYSDANWGTGMDGRRSTAEAEYRGLAHTVTKVVWLESLLSELHVFPSKKAAVWCDNSGAVTISANPMLHSKFKHVELDLIFVKEKVSIGKLIVGHVPAQEQVADVFTKPLSASLFTKFRSYLKVIAKHEQTAEIRKMEAC
ncbi:hypothetical protein CXB51_024811 [Gossypium anomalum]|uniref:Reverse transcriptase Ty1/copia-type domain-containing protein n=1 Tax=Gossypium anomalum TaxID=47600 RepID=A0A8J6CUC2_9ROSI|nr:hypothetical protein CXB51_024811 [Gossypium anomalum]